MLVLDANVVSELIRPEPTPTVAARIANRNAAELYLTAVSEAELLYGVTIMPTGRRQTALEAAIDRWLDLGFAGRILPFESSAARAYPVIASGRRRAGRPIAEADCQIAALSRKVQRAFTFVGAEARTPSVCKNYVGSATTVG